MAHLLHLDSSPRGERSHSRRLTREFVEAWKQTCPSDVITYRDIGRNPVPHADIYIIGVPMYNFSIPSTLKAYIDQIVRIGRTFTFEAENAANPYTPLVLGKKMFIIAVRGGYGFGAGSQYEMLNYQTTYLAAIFGFMGITDITFIELENDESGGQKLAEAIAQARIQIAQLIGR